MLAQLVTISLATLIVGRPIPINLTTAESSISRGEAKTTEKYQSTDDHTQVAIELTQTTNLQEILLHPTNHRLAVANKTEVFSNATEEVHLVKVPLVTESMITEHHETPKATTTTTTTTKAPETIKLPILKAIPTTIVEGTTESSTSDDPSAEVISGTTNIDIDSTQKGDKSETTSIQVVTPSKNDVSEGTVTPATSSTTELESESKEIRDKIKEVQAEPVILTVGV